MGLCAKRMKLEEKEEGMITLQLEDLSCKINLFGATVTSFKRGDGREALFVSKQAILDGSKPIRGGIPVVFPVFGADPNDELPSHGFARISMWEVLDSTVPHKVTLALDHNKVEWKLHPHSFRLEYDVELILPNSLKTSLRIMNSGGLLNEDGYEYQCLLHTYLNIGDISKVQIRGLGPNTAYVDQLHPAATRKVQSTQHAVIEIDQEVDHIYFANPNADNGGMEEIIVESEGKPMFSCQRSFRSVASQQTKCDVVVWNPWVEKSRKLADFGDEEYKEMLCVEPGNVGRRDLLRGGEDAVLTQVISML